MTLLSLAWEASRRVLAGVGCRACNSHCDLQNRSRHAANPLVEGGWATRSCADFQDIPHCNLVRSSRRSHRRIHRYRIPEVRRLWNDGVRGALDGLASRHAGTTSIEPVEPPTNTSSGARRTGADRGHPRKPRATAFRLEYENVTSPVILIGMTYRVGPKGQVVIPKALRDQLGIAPGDEVDVSVDNNAVRIEPVRPDAALRGSLRGLGLAALLEAEHRVELER